MIKLTQAADGISVYVKPDHILWIIRAQIDGIFTQGNIIATLIRVGSRTFAVSELPDQINRMIEEERARFLSEMHYLQRHQPPTF